MTNYELTRLYKGIMTILIPILYDIEKGIKNLMGLVLEKENYKQHYRAKLPTPIKPVVYDETIPNNFMNVVQEKAEAVHIEKLRITYSFPPLNVKPVTLFLLSLKTHGSANCRNLSHSTPPCPRLNSSPTYGLHELDVLALQDKMQHYHLDMESIPE